MSVSVAVYWNQRQETHRCSLPDTSPATGGCLRQERASIDKSGQPEVSPWDRGMIAHTRPAETYKTQELKFIPYGF